MSDKNKGGRPSIPVNPITAERLKRMRSIHRESQNEVGSKIGYKGSTYARYEKGERGIDYEDLKKLAVHWNTFVEYLTGEEDYSTEEEREEYFAEQRKEDIAAFKEVIEREKEMVERFKSLFLLSGFNYTKQPSSHLITDMETGIKATLDDSELQALVDRLRSTIQLECFIKSKQACPLIYPPLSQLR